MKEITVINSKELMYLLDHTPTDQNIMLSGRHGIGKSEILTKYYEERGMKVVALFLGQMSDPGDLIGLPNKDEKTGKTEFMPSYWFPAEGKPVVLFLDELNRARPEVLQCVMDLALNKKLAGRYLPQGSQIISAVNEGDEYQLTELDPALVSRFNIYRFEPSVEEWLAWAQAHELDVRVLNFIKKHPDWLDNKGSLEHDECDLTKTPDRRAWKRVSDIIKPIDELNDQLFKLMVGIVGYEATSLFYKDQTEQVDVVDFLKNFDKQKSVLASYRTHQFASLNEAILKTLNFASEKDAVVIMKGLSCYVNYLDVNSKREAFAHFAYNYGQVSYVKAKAYIDRYSPDIAKKIKNYHQSIK